MLTFKNEKWTKLETDFLRLTNSFLDLQKSQNDEYFKIHNSLVEVFSEFSTSKVSSEFSYQLNAFCSSFTYQAKYLYNFMKVFKTLILFIRAFRQNDWNLHLASLTLFKIEEGGGGRTKRPSLLVFRLYLLQR